VSSSPAYYVFRDCLWASPVAESEKLRAQFRRLLINLTFVNNIRLGSVYCTPTFRTYTMFAGQSFPPWTSCRFGLETGRGGGILYTYGRSNVNCP